MSDLKITVTFKNFDVTDSLRDHLEAKLSHVTRNLPSVREAQCIFKVERHKRHIVDITLFGNNVKFFAEAESTDMYASVDLVVHKLDSQLRRFKEKVKDHKKPEQTHEGELRYAEDLFDEKRLKEIQKKKAS